MNKLTLPTLSALALSLVCTQVFAVDGTIRVDGVITDGTCTLQGGSGVSGLKDLTVTLPTLPKSRFSPTTQIPTQFGYAMYLKNATGTANCDAATSKALKGVHLSAISPDDLDTTDKSLLVNKATGAGGASATNPVFIRLYTQASRIIDLSALWGTQESSQVLNSSGNIQIIYNIAYVSKTGIVDAQNVQAKINYTLMYN
ncbi:fimbrial protein [Acinetobacter sp. 1125_18A]|uniref:fimbrial protein n=1 Tax=Acinetobacter sp. 1125_18A TaxID=2605959 RepID=UPI0040592958